MKPFNFEHWLVSLTIPIFKLKYFCFSTGHAVGLYRHSLKEDLGLYQQQTEEAKNIMANGHTLGRALKTKQFWQTYRLGNVFPAQVNLEI